MKELVAFITLYTVFHFSVRPYFLAERPDTQTEIAMEADRNAPVVVNPIGQYNPEEERAESRRLYLGYVNTGTVTAPSFEEWDSKRSSKHIRVQAGYFRDGIYLVLDPALTSDKYHRRRLAALNAFIWRAPGYRGHFAVVKTRNGPQVLPGGGSTPSLSAEDEQLLYGKLSSLGRNK